MRRWVAPAVVAALGVVAAGCLGGSQHATLSASDALAQARNDGFVNPKRGRPVAKLVPVSKAGVRDVFGCMRGTVTVVGDLVAPLEEPWEADQ